MFLHEYRIQHSYVLRITFYGAEYLRNLIITTDETINIAEVDELISAIGTTPDKVIPILQGLQEKYNYLPEAALRRVAETTEIRPADISGVMSFYSQFRDKPAGEHFVRVCIGTACHVKGASNITDAFKRYLKLEGDEDTDKDRLFTVEEVACLGCCMLAPAVQIDDTIYGFVEPQRVGNILADFLSSRDTAGRQLISSEESSAEGEVRICLCSSCTASGSDAVFTELAEQIEELDLIVGLRRVGCTGISYQTPFVEVTDSAGNEFRYGLVKPQNVRKILLHHFSPKSISGKLKSRISGLLENLLTDRSREPLTRYSVDLRGGPDADYVRCQCAIATEHSGALDPLDFDEYSENGGGEALGICIKEKSEDEVIEEIISSGLRGRGGGGFPTGIKWRAVRRESVGEKYLVCNADEGDPGAFMDRMLLESFPFRVLEGIIIAALSIGIEKGFIYVRAEYPLAVRRLKGALEILSEKGWLGDDIMGSGKKLDITIVQGAGAFVCGEETALMAAVEGKRGMPRYRPPFPAQSGLFGKPTLINNVETFSLVPWIIRNGAGKFAELGTEKSKGTKSFALAGKVVRGGLIEVPMGITIREVVEEVGGGIQDGREFKAVQIGGPSGGCIPASLADTPIDYDALIGAGAIMGSGGLVVLDETDCMVDIARYFLTFTQLESCGKCTFCRIGTKRMLEILTRITEGEGKESDIEELENLAAMIKAGSLCNLGKTAPNPVLSTIKHFREEYTAHIAGKCPAGKCKALITYSINDTCIGCTKCAQSCPAGAIQMKPYRQHEIDAEKCIRCDSCRQICPVDAVEVH